MYLNRAEALELAQDHSVFLEFKSGQITGYIANGKFSQWVTADGELQHIGTLDLETVVTSKLPESGYVEVGVEYLDQKILDQHQKKNAIKTTGETAEYKPSTIIELKRSGQVKRRFNILLDDEVYNAIVADAVSKGLTRNQLIVSKMHQEYAQ